MARRSGLSKARCLRSKRVCGDCSRGVDAFPGRSRGDIIALPIPPCYDLSMTPSERTAGAMLAALPPLAAFLRAAEPHPGDDGTDESDEEVTGGHR